VIGTLMYVIEGEEHGFTSIPMSMYWAIVTITTVGYGDVTPQTPLGQMLSSLVMILGYSIIAVPTGIVTVELSRSKQVNALAKQSDHCISCGEEVSDTANYCSHCGHKLRRDEQEDYIGN
jgi:voltage-gated potassium channel